MTGNKFTEITIDPETMEIKIEGHGFSCSTGRDCLDQAEFFEGELGLETGGDREMKHAIVETRKFQRVEQDT